MRWGFLQVTLEDHMDSFETVGARSGCFNFYGWCGQQATSQNWHAVKLPKCLETCDLTAVNEANMIHNPLVVLGKQLIYLLITTFQVKKLSQRFSFVFSKHIHLGFGFNTRNSMVARVFTVVFARKKSEQLQVTGTCGHFLKLDNDSGKHGALGWKQKGHMKGLRQSMTCFFWKDILYKY